MPVGQYIEALRREFAVRDLANALLPLQTLYFGGGTPSRLGGIGVVGAIETVRQFAALEPDAEVTLEANPEDIDDDAIASWARAGINRLSIGIQSFDERVLQWMHRVHDATAASRAVAAARRGGIDSFSVDLIFSLPETLGRDWDADIEHILALNADHVSLYGLTFEPDTPLGRWQQRGEVQESPEERYEFEFLRAHERLTNAGYEHYEVSNFAKPGKRAVHNSAYWRHVPYVGVGPSAHGFDGQRRRWNSRHFAEWAALLETGVDPIAGDEVLDSENRAAEAVYLGLRTIDGLELQSPDEGLRAEQWSRQGWVEVVVRAEDGLPKHVRCTPMGWLRLDSLAADLTAIRSRS